MKLNVSKRMAQKKSESKQLRRAGMIPCVVYSQGKAGESLSVVESEFQECLRAIPKGRLATTLFNLVGSDGKERKAIIKDVQYHITTYNILHLDFEELHDDVSVNLNVPIECKGMASCVGIKLGGVLRQVLRTVRINCKPKDIPEAFVVDIAAMQMGDSKRLSDISFPGNVKPLVALDEVALAIVKR